jgi:hypothetical protein
VRTSGSTEAFTVNGPPGEIYIRLLDQDGHCTLDINAAEPRTGDLTSEAQATRVQLVLHATDDELADCLPGTRRP